MIVLLFQALLLAHGGLTTLGANAFSMAIAGPFAAYWIYNLTIKLGAKQKIAIFLAAAIAHLLTYINYHFYPTGLSAEEEVVIERVRKRILELFPNFF